MKVSIVTATYNSSDSIINCVNSILSQSYDNIEHIVVDGQSIDNTVDLVLSYSPNTVVISENIKEKQYQTTHCSLLITGK